ncbi:MAG: helix-turn-helix domain-containing protein [Firmicutes bacterium]|nr:helix-turn-helix domain-containing protein [Bacillota bacterium]
MEVGKRIVQLREKYGISRSALAKKSGVALSFVNSIERGEKEPTIHTLRRLCSVLGISLAEFFAEDKEPEPISPDVRRLVDLANRLTPRQREILLAAAEEWANLPENGKGE